MGLGRYADFVYIALAIGALFGALYLYTGAWPPVVTVQSNSMMHVDPAEYESGEGTTHADGLGVGRLGTLDPGDLVLLHDIEDRSEVTTYAEASRGSGGESTYGRPGDVVAFPASPQNEIGNLTVIHRAMTYVDVQETDDGVAYSVAWTDEWEEPEEAQCVRQPGYRCVFEDGGVTIAEVGLFDTRFGQSGFLTKGDNVVSNPGVDQAPTGPDQSALRATPIPAEELEGRAQGELPALGLVKLAFSGDRLLNANMQEHTYYLRIGNMVAPFDLWVLAGLEIVALSVAPFLWGVGRSVWRGRDTETVEELSVLAEAARARSRPAAPEEER